MDREDAEQCALRELERMAQESGVALALCRDLTVERRLGWAFFYNTQEFIETGRFSAQLAGNGPIVVMKSDGSTTCHGSRPVVDDILATLE